MKTLLTIALLTVATGCTSRSIPTADLGDLPPTADIEIHERVQGEGSSVMIFPFTLFGVSSSIAESNAIADAAEKAARKEKADFVTKPSTKIDHMNFLLFDISNATVTVRPVTTHAGRPNQR